MLNKLNQNPIRTLLYFVAFSMLLFGILSASPIKTISGLLDILVSPSALLTDYIVVGGLSSAFVNSSLVTLLVLCILDYNKIKYNGTTISSTFIVAGFSLFGKNILNILPIFLGVFIYAKFNGDSFKKYIYTALLGTSVAPVVSEVAFNMVDFGVNLQSIVLSVIVGTMLGFFLPTIALECLRILQGFNLYTTGFACGLIGILVTSLMSSFGYPQKLNMLWSEGRNIYLCAFLFLLFASFIIYGYILNGNSFNGYADVYRHSGRAVADFTLMDGIPVSFINMGVIGVFSLFYLIVLEGDVNGPTISGIFTIVGFGALGKHLKNMIPPMLGVLFMSFISNLSISDPSVQLSALFVTSLAPISGQFGPLWGIVAGVLHCSIVSCITSLHGGLNLYNNGFAAGLVVLIILPLIEALSKDV